METISTRPSKLIDTDIIPIGDTAKIPTFHSKSIRVKCAKIQYFYHLCQIHRYKCSDLRLGRLEKALSKCLQRGY